MLKRWRIAPTEKLSHTTKVPESGAPLPPAALTNHTGCGSLLPHPAPQNRAGASPSPFSHPLSLSLDSLFPLSKSPSPPRLTATGERVLRKIGSTPTFHPLDATEIADRQKIFR